MAGEKAGWKKEDLRGPIVETHMTTSEDGKWFIHKTVITDIKSRKYLEKVLEDDEEPKGSSNSRTSNVQR